jgi:hypothetical protein
MRVCMELKGVHSPWVVQDEGEREMVNWDSFVVRKL